MAAPWLALEQPHFQGNVGYGIQFYEAGTSFNLVRGNYIGTASNGTTALPANTSNGDYVEFANGKTNGGAEAGAGNVNSGNSGDGIKLYGATARLNLIQGNYIGTASNGTTALPNTGDGVYVEFAVSNTIGGTAAGTSNIISGNSGDGVDLYAAVGNVIEGNYIGVDKTGAAALPNTGNGVTIGGGSQSNIIGGTMAGAGNVISGNTSHGIGLYDAGTSQNFVQGNLVGTDKTGMSAIANSGCGILLNVGPTANTIGGTSAAARNVIGKSLQTGVYLYAASNNVVQGNYIGVNATGNTALSNAQYGIDVAGGSAGNLFGGSAAGAGNVIGGSGFNAVLLYNEGTTGNVFQGNSIGVGANGTAPLGNSGQAIWIGNGAASNVIGLALNGSGTGNLIANSPAEGDFRK